MKSLATIALIGLIGLTCFAPMHVNSHVYTDDGDIAHPASDTDEGYGETLGFVYGRVSVWAGYEYPKAHSVHSAYINNYSGGLPDWPNLINGLRFYVGFYSRMEGPHNYYDDDEWHDDGHLDSYWSKNPDALPGYWWVDHKHLKEYDLVTETAGDYTFTADSTLTAKKDLNGDRIREEDTWEADDELDIELRHQPLGVE